MKKLLLFLLLCLSLAATSFADYLDDWPDDALCGWMDNPSPPSYMVEEVKKRDISCAWGVVINNLPDSLDVVINNSNELFVSEEFLPDYPDFQKTTENTRESWLSTYGIKPEDLSPMLLELSKETQETVPECTDDFCFTTEAEYAPVEIINKGALINALYRQHPDYKIEPEWSYGLSSYCSEKKGCYQFKKDYSYEIKKDTKVITARWYPTELFPEKEIDPNCKTVDPEGSCFNREIPQRISEGTEKRGLFTPDVWLEENGLTAKDVINMLKDYPTTYRIDRKTMVEGKGGLVKIPQKKAKYSGYTDEIINTDQLLQSLLFWDPEVLGILDDNYGCIVGQDEGCTLDPNPLGYKTKTIWESPDKIVTYFEHECTDKMSGGEQINWKCQVLMGMVAPAGGECDPTPEKPCIENAVPTPLEPTPPVPIRPGWKIAEGSNFWSVDEDDPYWETEEGSKKFKAAKDRGSWIKTEASRYAQENPGVDAPIPSYYATDSCGEGKQEPGASC